jgi:hypothetical protein
MHGYTVTVQWRRTSLTTEDRWIDQQNGQKMNHNPESEQATYAIQVMGQLDESWADWCCGMTVTYGDGTSTLTGPVADQAALRGILIRIWDLNLTLISVIRIEHENREQPCASEE